MRKEKRQKRGRESCGSLGKEHSRKENSRCKGPGSKRCLVCLRKMEEASMAVGKWPRGRMEEMGAGRWWGQVMQDCWEDFDFSSEWGGSHGRAVTISTCSKWEFSVLVLRLIPTSLLFQEDLGLAWRQKTDLGLLNFPPVGSEHGGEGLEQKSEPPLLSGWLKATVTWAPPPPEIDLGQHFPNISVHTDPLEIMLKCVFWLSRSAWGLTLCFFTGVGLCCLVHGPHVK